MMQIFGNMTLALLNDRADWFLLFAAAVLMAAAILIERGWNRRRKLQFLLRAMFRSAPLRCRVVARNGSFRFQINGEEAAAGSLDDLTELPVNELRQTIDEVFETGED